ncbi:hypothetical protein BDU57DRAFT_113944 [Ampelomyces quisqualis]|uniref:Uncharacterized protein n=1 Tax=Ampelomyces quisqualis TaxID=50730 RepID=A0A6A5Q7U2_AMPQU|nr:hypothetical protein BDU57DRAFT_113944 [Ampelomyces quisqualis]
MIVPENREQFRNGNGINVWEAALLRQFNPVTAVATKKSMNERFGLVELRKGRRTSEFIMTVIGLSEEVGHSSDTDYHIAMAYNKIDAELRFASDSPEEGTTIDAFIKKAEAKETVWKDRNEALSKQRPAQDDSNSHLSRDAAPLQNGGASRYLGRARNANMQNQATNFLSQQGQTQSSFSYFQRFNNNHNQSDQYQNQSPNGNANSMPRQQQLQGGSQNYASKSATLFPSQQNGAPGGNAHGTQPKQQHGGQNKKRSRKCGCQPTKPTFNPDKIWRPPLHRGMVSKTSGRFCKTTSRLVSTKECSTQPTNAQLLKTSLS